MTAKMRNAIQKSHSTGSQCSEVMLI